MKIILFSTRAWRTQTPTSLLTRFGATRIFHIGTTSRTTRFRLGNNPWVGLHMERLQPGSTTMVTGKRNALTKMRRHVRPCQFTGQWAELDRMPLARMRRLELRIFIRRFPLGQRLIPFPSVVPNRTVIGQNLPLLVIGMTRSTLRRQHVLNPVLDIYDTGILSPVTFPPLNHLELGTKPVHRLTCNLVRAYPLWNTTLTIRKFCQRTHNIGTAERIVPILKSVVNPPVAPHARDIVVCYMAMK